jgi:molybdopterin converting factor small subunit
VSIAVHLSPSLRHYSRCDGSLTVGAGTVRGALAELEDRHPTLYSSVCDETGAVRRHINLFVNASLIPVRDPKGLDAALQPGDVLTILPAVSGG